MFPQPYVPSFLRIFFSLKILKIRPYVPTALCSLSPMFPHFQLFLQMKLSQKGLGLGLEVRVRVRVRFRVRVREEKKTLEMREHKAEGT